MLIEITSIGFEEDTGMSLLYLHTGGDVIPLRRQTVAFVDYLARQFGIL